MNTVNFINIVNVEIILQNVFKKKEGTKKYKYTDFIFIFNTKYKIMPLETDELIKV